jgi:hypothetical protein
MPTWNKAKKQFFLAIPLQLGYRGLLKSDFAMELII